MVRKNVWTTQVIGKVTKNGLDVTPQDRGDRYNYKFTLTWNPARKIRNSDDWEPVVFIRVRWTGRAEDRDYYESVAQAEMMVLVTGDMSLDRYVNQNGEKVTEPAIWADKIIYVGEPEFKANTARRSRGDDFEDDYSRSSRIDEGAASAAWNDGGSW